MSEKSLFKELLDFNKMITPTIIKVIYYISVVIALIIGVTMIITGMTMRYGGGTQVFLGIIMLVVSPLIVRMYFEIFIVIFKIHDRLASIDDRQSKNNPEQ